MSSRPPADGPPCRLGRDHSGSSRATRTHRSIGPSLYDGTSGIALFFARLYEVTKDPSAFRLSLGAIRQALASLDQVDVMQRGGCFVGLAGIAYACIQVATILDNEYLLREGKRVAELIEFEAGSREYDIISGRAGAVITLVNMANLLGDTEMLERAETLGKEIVNGADTVKDRSSWPSSRATDAFSFTGFSHGASGIVYALLRLFESTHEIEYKKYAAQGIHYEQSWFSSSEGNWADLREVRSKRRVVPRYSTYWCHGAPGIALARMKASSVLGEQYEREFLIALDTTAKSISASLDTAWTNCCLCHGLVGNADVLKYSCRREQRYQNILMQFAAMAARRYKGNPSQWPCGLPEPSPGLMCGLAGIGMFFLHVNSPSLSSVLAVDL